MPRKATIVILTWNGLEHTRRCLDSLSKTLDPHAADVIVVDNGSTDGTLEHLRARRWLRVIANPTNLGFVQGNNLGIRAADPASDLVLLNNDIVIEQADWLERLRATAHADPRNGVVGCRLRTPRGNLQHAGTYILPDTYWGQQIGGGEKDIGQYGADREVEGIVFACAYLRREVVARVGLLDEDYFSYFEDTDYCLKARAAGFRTVCCGGVTLQHHEHASTTANQVSQNAMFLKSQAIFKRKWKARFAAERYRGRLNWRSLLNFASGYALSSRALVEALDRHGIEVGYRYAYGPGTVMPLTEPEQTGSYLLNCVRQRGFAEGAPEVVYAQGDAFDANRGQPKIGFTMLETDGVPAEWVRQANRMDEVWVPSTFNVETFRASGVRRPLHVVPLGIDPGRFNPGIAGHRDPRVFTFLSVFEWGERKSPETLLSAFADEFGPGEDAVLICKILSREPEGAIRQQIADMNLGPGAARIVISLNDEVPASQLGSLYRSADCFVLSTRGEGWGMPILEAMACGVPAIATNWSAQTDFLNDANGYPLAVEKLVPARAKCPYYDGFRWAEPSREHLRTLLRHVYEHPEEARRKGLAASAEALGQWTWDHSAQRIVARLEALAGDKYPRRGGLWPIAANPVPIRPATLAPQLPAASEPAAPKLRLAPASISPRRRWRVGIFGTFDVENYGDLLFPLLASAELGRRLGDVTVHAFSYRTKSTPGWPYAVTSLTELPRVAEDLDAFLIGGGFLIRFDKDVAPGYFPPSATIPHPTGYWLSPALLAAQRGIPLVWNAPGMHGNAIPAWAAPLLEAALAHSARIAVRDEPTRAGLAPFVDPARIETVPDTAFALGRALNEGTAAAARAWRAAAGLHAPYIVVQATALERYARFFRRHADRLGNLRLLGLPIGPALGDVVPAAIDLPNFIRSTSWPDPLALAELIRGAEAVVGNSYHLQITALTAGVPVFTPVDLSVGKYTALQPFDTIRALPWDGEVDAEAFFANLGRRSPSPQARAAEVAVVRHWDAVAAAVRDRQVAAPVAADRLWQMLPALLENAA